MNIPRKLFEEHKNNVWLIKLKKDKYLHIPKPKTVIKGILQVLKWIIFIPILLIVGICYGIYEGIGQIVCNFSDTKKAIQKDIT